MRLSSEASSHALEQGLIVATCMEMLAGILIASARFTLCVAADVTFGRPQIDLVRDPAIDPT